MDTIIKADIDKKANQVMDQVHAIKSYVKKAMIAFRALSDPGVEVFLSEAITVPW